VSPLALSLPEAILAGAGAWALAAVVGAVIFVRSAAAAERREREGR
jgi:hypothetical protein